MLASMEVCTDVEECLLQNQYVQASAPSGHHLHCVLRVCAVFS